MPIDCPKVRDHSGMCYRCPTCGARWDADDDAPPCPRQIATRAPGEDHSRANRYVSALAPPFVDNLHKR